MIVKYLTIQFLCFELLVVCGLNIVNPGPKYPPTKGEVWPKPQEQTKEATYYSFDPTHFKVEVTNQKCDILTAAVQRYSYVVRRRNGLRSRERNIRTNKNHQTRSHDVRPNPLYQGSISKLEVVLTAPCEDYPSFGMDERYTLTVSNVSVLESNSIWGIIRGLETFAQLFYISADYNEIYINVTSIVDFPSYPHRGLLLDTSRHYISVGNILKTLDAMAVNKMNVFHWHIVDDQSFPYQSERLPELSEKGAFHSSMVYTKEDIERIIQYARVRGIRVIPEFDVPGHTRSWGVAYPSILTQCYSRGEVVGLGPMDPLNDIAFDLLRNLFAEVQQWFPDKFFHIGGDEVDLDCWLSNPKLIEYMQKHDMTATDLHAQFMRNAIPLLGNGTNAIVWQEVFDEMVPLSEDTIVQVWKSGPTNEMIKVLSAGNRVLFSSYWYLDYLGSEWPQFYSSDPRQMVYDALQNATLLDNIVGGEACMWGEMADERNVISRVWPRASAVAEKLWSSTPVPQLPYREAGSYRRSRGIPDEVYRRMEEHACRMVRRGIDAAPPSGPGFCVA